MKYPYIGRGRNKAVYIALSDLSGYIIKSDKFDNRELLKRLNTSHMENITREYLEGKCVKVESPEHMNFIAILGVNSGFELLPPSGNDYIEFCSSGKFKACREHGRVNEWITIPLPPESKPKDDWQVGDTVTWGGCVASAEVLAIHNKVAWVLNENGNYSNVEIDRLKKPKTEAEILRDELTQDINEMINNDSSTNAFVDLIIDKYIAKNPQ